MNDDLALLQRRLARRILDAERDRDDLAGLIVETPGMSRAVRLSIYADAYLLRLDEALRGNFPKLHLLLGDDDFYALTEAYAAAHPSRRRSIRWFGDRLADFLAATPRYAGLPLLAELARFEWTLGLAFDAADAETVALTRLHTLADHEWPDLKVAFHPAFARLDHQWNTVAVWQALDADETPPRPQPHAQGWQCWRDELTPRYRSQDEDEAALCRALQDGLPFGLACEVLLARHDEDAAPGIAAACLGRWLAEGVVASLESS